MNYKMDEQIKDILQNIPDKLRVAEDGVDLSVQQEYLNSTDKFDYDQYSGKDITAKSQSLFDPKISLSEKKEALVILAHQGTVECYRTIEKYLEKGDQELENWAILALHECRMFLEGCLLDQNVGMVMTGLGGKGNRLRYFFIIRSIENIGFTKTQKISIEQAFGNTCDRFNSILEEIQLHQGHARVQILLPLDVAVGEVIEKGIVGCNMYGSFLDDHYYVTNDKIPTETEILYLLRKISGNGK